MRKTKENGITLIALIITIIVMLILVGVTVSVALNGGLFETAKDAANRTQIEADREVLQAAIVGALDENLVIPNADSLKNNLPEGWKVTGLDGGPYTATSPKGNKFKVFENGIIEYKEPSTGDLALLEKYFLGESEEGRDLLTLIDENGETFLDDPETIADASSSMILIAIWQPFDYTMEYYAKYNEKVYKITTIVVFDEDDTIKFNTQNVELVYEPQGREGEKVAYDSNNDGTAEEWMIIYDNGDNIEMVSMSNMGTLTLGYNDEAAQAPGDIDKDGSSSTDIDKAIYSYNNAITRLNSYCASLVTKEDANRISVRSIGSNPNNPSNENSTLYKSERIGKLYNGLGKNGDMNYEQDFVRMSYYNCSSTEERYWLASRRISDAQLSMRFIINTVDKSGKCNTEYISNSQLWEAYFSINNVDGGANSDTRLNGVRPVIKMKAGSI